MFRVYFFSLLAISGMAFAGHRHLTFQQALDRRLIEAKAAGTGGYKGYCIEITVRNLTTDSIDLKLEPGKRMNSADDNEQDILLVSNERIRLKGRESKTCKVRGYCCQASNRAPKNGSKFLFNGRSDSMLVKVARYLNQNCTTDGVAQEAIWAISENRSASSIAALEDTSVDQLRRYVAGLRGERLPWYRVRSFHQQRSDGSIVTSPAMLTGRVTYTCEDDEYVTLRVLDGKGMPVCLILSEWRFRGVNQYDVQLPVAGLKKGRYTVEIASNYRTLFSESVEL